MAEKMLQSEAFTRAININIIPEDPNEEKESKDDIRATALFG